MGGCFKTPLAPCPAYERCLPTFRSLAGPARRWLALRYCNLVNKEVEYLTISRDTTEADIKVRREISGGMPSPCTVGVVVAVTTASPLPLQGQPVDGGFHPPGRCARRGGGGGGTRPR